MTLDPLQVDELVARSLAEDVGTGDVTTKAIVPEDARADATIVQKAPGVIYGLDVAEAAFRSMDPDVEIERRCEEGVWREGGEVLVVAGKADALLAAERTALNFLQRLSGVATAAARAVKAVEGTGVTILDTRKTTPGLRALEKYAVRSGGGTNHRMGLDDAILIKDNHLRIAGGVEPALAAVRATGSDRPVEIEADTLEQVEQALRAGAERILLDNMSPAEVTRAVEVVRGRALLEASGGISEDRVRAYAETGVDFISIGALTHGARSLHVSLEVT